MKSDSALALIILANVLCTSFVNGCFTLPPHTTTPMTTASHSTTTSSTTTSSTTTSSTTTSSTTTSSTTTNSSMTSSTTTSSTTTSSTTTASTTTSSSTTSSTTTSSKTTYSTMTSSITTSSTTTSPPSNCHLARRFTNQKPFLTTECLTEDVCIQTCNLIGHCLWSTFDAETKTCSTYMEDLDPFDDSTAECKNCKTNQGTTCQPHCTANTLCSLEGLLTFEENVPNVKTCWKHCNYYENCAWYSYEREAGLCFLLENCANPIPGEEEFVSGEAAPNCNEDDFAYE